MFGNMTFVQAKVEIDEKTLQEIADATGGRYFRATDNEKLRAIYDEINRLEKSKVEVADFTTYHRRVPAVGIGGAGAARRGISDSHPDS